LPDYESGSGGKDNNNGDDWRWAGNSATSAAP